MFKKLSLQFKLILAFLVLVFVLAGVSAYQIRQVRYFNNVFLGLVDGDFARLNALDDIRLQSTQIRDQTFEVQQDIFEGEKIDVVSERAKITESGRGLRTVVGHYITLAQSDSNTRVSTDELQQLDSAGRDVAAKSLAVVDATGTSTDQQKPESAEDALSAAQDKLSTMVENAAKREQVEADISDHQLDHTVSQLQWAIIVLAILSTGLALTLGIIVSSWISRGLSHIKKGAEFIANGDFTHPIEVKTSDEIGQLATAFNHMSERLRDAYRRQAVAQQRDEAMMLSMGEGLIAMDEKGEVTLMNKVAATMFDLPSEAAAVGKKVQDLYQLYPANPKEDQPIPLEQRPSYIALHGGKSSNEVYGFRKADGRKYLLNISANPVVVNDKVAGAITVLRDVTKEKEVDRMKTEFISLASHQLRTPLSAIKWFSEMLVSGDAGELEPEQLDFAKNIADSTERMIDLVNALLNISRIESGRIMVDPKPTDLKELVSGIVNDLKAKTEEKQQTLIISVHDDLPKINLDPRLIGQVYMNLLTNAIKYTPKGGEVSVFISRKDDDIISQVTDNGYGIPKEQQGQIFQKFFRAANAVKVETDGTGLGLYLIKAVVESSGGKIWFKSEEGKGTTFWFSMPVTGMQRREGEVTLDA